MLWVREPGSWGSQGCRGRRPLGKPRVWGLGHPPPLTRAALGPLAPRFASWEAEGGADLSFCLQGTLPPPTRGSTGAWLFCQLEAGSVGDSGLGFRRLWGFGWVSCGLGFLGSRLNLQRRQSQAFSCYESHIVWPCPGWGGGLLAGASSYSPGLSPLPVAHPGPCPGSRLQHIQPLLPSAGAGTGHTGERVLEGGSGGGNREDG